MRLYSTAAFVALAVSAAGADPRGLDDAPPFCAAQEAHRVIGAKQKPGPAPGESARLCVFWKGMRWRWWRTQCKVALNGRWVAVLSPNTYTVLDVKPGKQRLCAAGSVMGTFLEPTWRSLLFLHATAGQTYYIECSPGGDDAGANEPTLSEPDLTSGENTVSKLRLVTFEAKQER